MARCFPFNRFDYLKEIEYAKDERLIESIKLQTEKENAKERKKEKKEKREKKHKSGKSKEHQANSKQEERSHKKRKHSDRNQLGDQDDFSRKPIKDDVTQQVDKSSLTEESGPCFNLNPNDSSESTQDSSKRRKLTAPDASASLVPAQSSSGLTFRFKSVQKQAIDGERPATSAQLPPGFSSRAVDGEQLQVKNRSPLVQGNRDQGPSASNKLDVALDRNNVLPRPFGLQKPADGERPAASVQLQPRFSGRAVDGGQLQMKDRTPLIQKRSDPVPPSSNKLAGVLDRNNVPPPKPTDGKRPATSVQSRLPARTVDGGQLQDKNRTPVMQKSSGDLVPPSPNKLSGVLDRNNVLSLKPTDGKRPATSVQSRLPERAVDGGQLQDINRTPVMQKSSGDLVPPSPNKLSGVLDRNNVLLPKPTDRKRPATSVLPQPRLSGRDGGQLQVKNRTPVVQKRSDLVPPPPHKLAGVLDKKNVLLEPCLLQKPTDGKKPATSVPPQPKLSGRAVDEGQLQAQNRTTLTQKSVPPSSKKLAGPLDRDNFLLPPSQLQKPTDGKRPATSVQSHPRFSGQAVDGGQHLKNRTPLIQNNRNPPPSPNKAGVLDRVLQKPADGERPATSGQTESSFSGRDVDGTVKNRTPVSLENRDLGPPASNKLNGVSDMDMAPPLPKILQKHNAPDPPFSSRVTEGVTVETSQGHTRNSKKHKSSRSSSKDEVRRLFNDLVVNWAPPASQFDLPDDDDQDWLFASKRSGVQRCAPSPPPPPQPEQGSSMPSYQTLATYLPEADMYALPYVVPF